MPTKFDDSFRQHSSITSAYNQISNNLKSNPLAEGEQLNLGGYSYGSVLQAQVALKLADEGTVVDNLVLIGSPISDDSSLYKQLSGNENIKNIIRVDIEGDLLSNSSFLEYMGGAAQVLFMGDDAPHFDLARPGAEADAAIQKAVQYIIDNGVKN